MWHNQEVMVNWSESIMTQEEYKNNQFKDLVKEDPSKGITILQLNGVDLSEAWFPPKGCTPKYPIEYKEHAEESLSLKDKIINKLYRMGFFLFEGNLQTMTFKKLNSKDSYLIIIDKKEKEVNLFFGEINNYSFSTEVDIEKWLKEEVESTQVVKLTEQDIQDIAEVEETKMADSPFKQTFIQFLEASERFYREQYAKLPEDDEDESTNEEVI